MRLIGTGIWAYVLLEAARFGYAIGWDITCTVYRVCGYSGG